MKLWLTSLGAAVLMLSGPGLTVPAAAATSSAQAEFGAAAASRTGMVAIWKTSSTHIQLPTVSGTNTTCEMSQGAQGSHVRALQRAQNHCAKR
ncbi:hypothetical protein [Streptomyces sp. NPDC002845]